jgi:hypothetical protein
MIISLKRAYFVHYYFIAPIGYLKRWLINNENIYAFGIRNALSFLFTYDTPYRYIKRDNSTCSEDSALYLSNQVESPCQRLNIESRHCAIRVPRTEIPYDQ